MEERLRQYLMSKNYVKNDEEEEGIGCLIYIWVFAFLLAVLAIIYVIKKH